MHSAPMQTNKTVVPAKTSFGETIFFECFSVLFDIAITPLSDIKYSPGIKYRKNGLSSVDNSQSAAKSINNGALYLLFVKMLCISQGVQQNVRTVNQIGPPSCITE